MLSCRISRLVLFGASALALVAACRSPHHAAAERCYREFRNASESPRPLAYPELEQVARALFEPEAVSIRFRSFELRAGAPHTLQAGTIWYSHGDLFVQVDEFDRGHTAKNYATIGNDLVSWNAGAREGIAFTRYPGDTVDFLWYIVDPSAFKKAIYFEYLRDPEQFSESSTPSGTELLFRKPLEGFLGVVVVPKPLWLSSLMFEDPSAGGSPRVVMEMLPPEAVPALPPHVSKLANGITFERSEFTIKAHMEYL